MINFFGVYRIHTRLSRTAFILLSLPILTGRLSLFPTLGLIFYVMSEKVGLYFKQSFVGIVVRVGLGAFIDWLPLRMSE